jgi:signal transduction histidine kinase
MQREAAPKKVALSLLDDQHQGQLIFNGDADRVRQLLYILIDNGINYTDPGGSVTVSVLPAKNKGMQILVTNTGCGIAEKDIPHIFERFSRVDMGRTRHTGGTGLGRPSLRKSPIVIKERYP